MNHEEAVKEIVTISEMARMTRLSRSRFYQLMKEGVFPEPQRNATTNRPFYDRSQQEACLEVRRRNCGVNGRPVLFYLRPSLQPISPSISRRHKKPKVAKQDDQKASGHNHRDPLISDLRHGLAQLGMPNIEESTIRAALADQYPDGWQNVEPGAMLMGVFRRLRSTNSTEPTS